MALLTRLGAGIAANAVLKIGRRLAREAAMRRKAYLEGYADAKAGRKSKF